MPKSKKNSNASDELKSYVARIVRLEEEKRELSSDIKDVKSEAASRGFDRAVLTQMVREAMMDDKARAKQREHESLCEVYRASLGMLRGTPLGDAARERLAEDPDDTADESDPSETASRDDDAPGEPPRGAMTQEEIDGARTAGADAAGEGQKIYANPYVAGDPRRAAWDEGWCQRTGSDGMDIPKAWRRAKKPEKADDAPGDGAPA